MKRLAPLVVRAPRATFAVFDRFARVAFRGPDRQRLARIFPELSGGDARRADRWSRQQLLRNRILMEAVRSYGYDRRIAAIALPQPLLASLSPPAILTTFHVGALSMLGFALEQLPAKVLVIRRRAGGTPHPMFEAGGTDGSEQDRAQLFHRCAGFLRSGQFVFIAADPLPSQKGSLRVPFRKGFIDLARGPFALSRIADVPIIPLVVKWRGARAEFVLGDPIPPSRDETVTAAALAAWLDAYLSAAPLEISWHTLTLMT